MNQGWKRSLLSLLYFKHNYFFISPFKKTDTFNVVQYRNLGQKIIQFSVRAFFFFFFLMYVISRLILVQVCWNQCLVFMIILWWFCKTEWIEVQFCQVTSERFFISLKARTNTVQNNVQYCTFFFCSRKYTFFCTHSDDEHTKHKIYL